MYEFHGWFGIAESPEEADAGTLEEGLAELRAAVDRIDWSTGEALDALIHFIARRFPGSWGLLYERSADMDQPPGPGAFRVRVMARGEVQDRLDPFLSPCRPVIED
jgi:hypothetical protein